MIARILDSDVALRFYEKPNRNGGLAGALGYESTHEIAAFLTTAGLVRASFR